MTREAAWFLASGQMLTYIMSAVYTFVYIIYKRMYMLSIALVLIVCVCVFLVGHDRE